MPSLFENVGHDTNELDQEDCKDTYNFLWEYCKRMENEYLHTLQDFKDVFLYAEQEDWMTSQFSIKEFRTISLMSSATDFARY